MVEGLAEDVCNGFNEILWTKIPLGLAARNRLEKGFNSEKSCQDIFHPSHSWASASLDGSFKLRSGICAARMDFLKKDTFRSSNLKISTADGSTTLEIEGTGVVNLVLKSPDRFRVRVSLSEVAYAPQGKCNLFSAGMFVRKAKVTGVYNEQYMTWMNDAGHTIGHAVFGNGLYHLGATKLPSDDMPGDAIAATVDFDDPVWKWHRRLGHLGFQNMLNLLDSSTGM